MNGYLKFVGVALLLLIPIPLGTIYRQNIELWAEARGLDGVLSKGVAVLNANPWGPWLLFAFVFVLGGTATLWAEYFLRRKFPPKFNTKKKIVEGEVFRHVEVVIDGKSFRKCRFDGVKLVYEGSGAYDFIECSFGDFSIKAQNDAGYAAIHLFRLIQASGRPVIFGNQKPPQHPDTATEMRPKNHPD